MVNNVIGVVNYVIAARPSLLNFMIADSRHAGKHHENCARAKIRAPLTIWSPLTESNRSSQWPQHVPGLAAPWLDVNWRP
jgi:hypothetical protein